MTQHPHPQEQADHAAHKYQGPYLDGTALTSTDVRYVCYALDLGDNVNAVCNPKAPVETINEAFVNGWTSNRFPQDRPADYNPTPAIAAVVDAYKAWHASKTPRNPHGQ